MKIIYIAGDGRSGSTILDAILGNASETISVGECCRFWTRFNEKKTLCGCGDKIEECLLWSKIDISIRNKFPNYNPIDFEKKVKHILLFKNFNKIPKYITNPAWKEFCEIVKFFYISIAQISDKNTIIDSTKFPSWVAFLIQLDFCEIKVIHLERNLQSVANSWKKKILLPEYYDQKIYMPIKSNFLILKSWIKVKYLSAKIKKTGDYLFVNYESFCNDNSTHIVKIEDFTGITINSENLKIPFNHSIGGNPVRNNTGKNEIIVDNKKDTLKNLNYVEKIFFKSMNKLVKAIIQ